MKQADIKRLEKAVEHLQKAKDLLDKTYDSLEEQPEEYLYFGISKTRVTTLDLVKEMLSSVSYDSSYIKGKIKVFKEEFTDKKTAQEK